MKELHLIFTLGFSILVMMITLSALKKMWNGYNGWRNGDQDITELMAGMLMLITPLIIFAVYAMFGMADATISVSDIKALKDFK